MPPEEVKKEAEPAFKLSSCDHPHGLYSISIATERHADVSAMSYDEHPGGQLQVSFFDLTPAEIIDFGNSITQLGLEIRIGKAAKE